MKVIFLDSRIEERRRSIEQLYGDIAYGNSLKFPGTGLFLSILELEELTGRQRRHAQRSALRAMGIEHKVRPDGQLLVLRSHLEKTMDGYSALYEPRPPRHEPKWDAIK